MPKERQDSKDANHVEPLVEEELGERVSSLIERFEPHDDVRHTRRALEETRAEPANLWGRDQLRLLHHARDDVSVEEEEHCAGADEEVRLAPEKHRAGDDLRPRGDALQLRNDLLPVGGHIVPQSGSERDADRCCPLRASERGNAFVGIVP